MQGLFEWFERRHIVWKILIVILLIILVPSLLSALFELFLDNMFIGLVIIFGGALIFGVVVLIKSLITGEYYKLSSDDSSSSSSSSSSTGIPAYEVIEAIKKDVQSRGTSWVAIFYYDSTWRLVNYWGLTEWVTVQVDSGTGKDYFVTQSGDVYPAGINADRNQIYYFSK